VKNARRKKLFIITGLLIANILAFSATSWFFSKKMMGNGESKSNNVNYFKRGWQVMNFTFSVIDYLNPSEQGGDKQ